MVDSIVIASTTLLGVDSIANIWKSPRKPPDDNTYESVWKNYIIK
jgi:hypothetical protein